MIQSTLITLRPNEYTQRFRYYPLAVNLDIRVGSFVTLNDLSKEVCPEQNRRFNLSIFNMTAGINESKTWTKDTSCECYVNLIVENVIQIKVE